MADTKITALAAIATVDPAADVLPIVDISDTSMAASGTTKKVTSNQILGSGGVATLASATITGAATVGTTLGVTGASTLASVGVTGAATVGTTLGVTGQLSTANVLKTTGNPSLGVAGATEAFVAHNTGYGAILYGQGTTCDAALLDRNTGLRLTVTTSGAQVSGDLTVSTGNVVMATSGKGIDFSAVTGGTGTATANVLNDYEEGTFTPTISSGATAVTYSVQYGRYTKVGRLVTVYAQITTTTATRDANQFIIDGLPFSTAVIGSGAIGYSNSGFISTAGGNKPNLYVSGSAVEFYNSAGGSFAGTTIASDNFDIRFTATYFA